MILRLIRLYRFCQNLHLAVDLFLFFVTVLLQFQHHVHVQGLQREGLVLVLRVGPEQEVRLGVLGAGDLELVVDEGQKGGFEPVDLLDSMVREGQCKGIVFKALVVPDLGGFHKDNENDFLPVRVVESDARLAHKSFQINQTYDRDFVLQLASDDQVFDVVINSGLVRLDHFFIEQLGQPVSESQEPRAEDVLAADVAHHSSGQAPGDLFQVQVDQSRPHLHRVEGLAQAPVMKFRVLTLFEGGWGLKKTVPAHLDRQLLVQLDGLVLLFVDLEFKFFDFLPGELEFFFQLLLGLHFFI